jgi:UDP-GlcNAc:undecaprenyl-phosphate GlcNAc-1-phosphate transferase
MNTLLAILGISFGLGVVLMPVARAAAARCGLIDRPDERRKIHGRPIPLSGGIVVFLAASSALAIAVFTKSWLRDRLLEQGTGLLGLFLAVLVICAVGLVDDFRPLRGRHKLLGQLAAVSIVMGSGVVVQNIHLFGQQLDLGPLALPFTALWLLGAINSLNLIDGMDGLLASVAVIISLAMAVLAINSNQLAAAAVALALAGALLAFLLYNFPPASVFLGDCGSMLVGLVVGVLAIQCSLKGPATVALAAPTALLTIPFFDTLAAVVRRKLTGRSIYSTDRGHIHHCLRRSGLSDRRVLLFVSFLCLLTVSGALASLFFNNELLALIAAMLVISILVIGRLFGYAEFLLFKQRLVGLWTKLARGSADGPACQMEVRLQGSADWTELWSNLTRGAAELGLKNLFLDVNLPAIHEGYHARWDRFDDTAAADASTIWKAEIPLVVRGQRVGRLEIAGDRNHVPVCGAIAAASQLVDQVEFMVAQLTAPQAEPCPSPFAKTPTSSPEPVLEEIVPEQVRG